MAEGLRANGAGPPDAVRELLQSLAATLDSALALISRDDKGTRFEGEWLPQSAG